MSKSLKAGKVFPPIGMGPAIWGPLFWKTMHIVSLGYSPTPTPEEQAGAIAFYESLTTAIPCPICKQHYEHFLEEIPVRNAVQSRDALIEWVFEIHNKVNVELGKPVFTWEQYIASIQALAAQTPASQSRMGWTMTLAAGLAAGAVLGAGAYAIYHTKK